jgi:hypothetical protein
MEFPVLFDVREGGTEMVVRYSSSMASNNWLKMKLERGVAAGMKKRGHCLQRRFN